jgi:cytochrome c oxidase cbb3-type subunit 3
MPTKVEKDAVSGTDTTGHEWDGIRELNTPLPRWWLYTFYACILFAVVYSILYPSVPWLHGHFKGILGYSQRAVVARSLAAVNSERAGMRQQLAAASLAAIAKDPELFAFAQIGGRAAFADNCVPCHRAGGAGAKGFPNLADDDWLWGGKLADIQQTITHGIRSNDPDARQSAMPRFGADKILTPEQIGDVADYVMSLSQKLAIAPEVLARGQALFAQNCVACHGETGTGNRDFGAPNLADQIWLYGGDKPTIVETITNGRSGIMPAWGGRLDPVTIKMLAIYVHALGGGE